LFFCRVGMYWMDTHQVIFNSTFFFF
jgi:hypothetical protein